MWSPLEVRLGFLTFPASLAKYLSIDLHGDLSHALKILRTASLVDQRGYWIGKDTTLIQTGDIVDRGPDTIAIYRLFDSLRTQAAGAGGEVISLLGNHEVCVYVLLS